MRPFSLTCSIGVASFPIHASVPSGLVVAADAAVYVAKRAGKNWCAWRALPPLPSPLPSPLVRS
ncbi:MAG: diguanylate cyclase [Nitrospirae bacterium]|nr:MAG: diguanylate cyclase [Nitrospirota bacterium]